jgi:hypothetical protein
MAWLGEHHESPESAIYVGLDSNLALERASADRVEVVRVVAGVIPDATVRAAESTGLKVVQPRPNSTGMTAITLEYRQGNARLNVVVVDDVVSKASFF